MALFDNNFQVMVLLVVVFHFGTLCYRTGRYLCSSNGHGQLWELLLLFLLICYNLSDGYLTRVDVGQTAEIRLIFRYAVAFAIAGYLPVYFYHAHGLWHFKMHLRYGFYLGYLLPYLLFFCLAYPLTGDPSLATGWGMGLPFLYSLLLFYLLAKGTMAKLAEQKGRHVREQLGALKWDLVAVGPWLFMTFFIYWEVDRWVELLCANMGFVLKSVYFFGGDVRDKYIQARLTRHLSVEAQLGFEGRCTAFGLTRREVEVAELLCCGLTYKEIGEQLFISEHTVDNHVQHIFAKAGVKRRMELYGKLRGN